MDVKMLLLICSLIPTTSLAAPGSLKQCQGYVKKIEYYTALRRQGGAAKSMEKWKQKRRDYKQRYTRKHCKDWGSALRRK